MKIVGNNRCISCMQLLDKRGECPHCHFDQNSYDCSASCLQPGICLNGKYILGKVLGEGGFGITYIAWDVVLTMPVAIKEYYPEGKVGRDTTLRKNTQIHIHAGTQEEEFNKGMEAFLKEARALSKFWKLEGIVAVRDFFKENHTAYIVMEFIDGLSVNKYIKKNGKMDAKQVLNSMQPVFLSLAQVHKDGIIHRDISADNLMLMENGEIRLIDFGAARPAVREQRTMTVSFKRGFSPEEQYRSKGVQGPWSDIYSLCATMYFMITGIMPEESVERILHEKLVPLEKMEIEGLSLEQKKALDKGMAVLAKDRFFSLEPLYHILYPGEQALEQKDFSVMKTDAQVGKKDVDSGERAKNGTQQGGKIQVSHTAIRRELGSAMHSAQSKTDKRKQMVPALGVVLVLAAGIFVGSRLYGDAGNKGNSRQQLNTASATITPMATLPESTPVPAKKPVLKVKVKDMTGLLYKSAAHSLRSRGLRVKKVLKVSSKSKNIVVGQSIPSGTKVKKNKLVKLYVSRGEEKTPASQSGNVGTAQNTPVPKTVQPTRKPKKDDSAGSLDKYLD